MMHEFYQSAQPENLIPSFSEIFFRIKTILQLSVIPTTAPQPEHWMNISVYFDRSSPVISVKI